jgi:3-oxoacyl-[acyl-carrier-protein] synthase-1
MNNSDNDKIVIAGIGMATPVGLSAKNTYYTSRTGVSMFEEINTLDKQAQPIVMATIPDDCLAWSLPNEKFIPPAGTTERLFSLYRLACEDLTCQLSESDINDHSLPLFLGVPDALFNKDLVQQLFLSYSDLNMNEQSIRAYSDGRASSLIALHEALNHVRSGQCKGAYIAGCDTYKDLMILERLDKKSRLKSSGNLDGFIPGEGACIFLITTEQYAKQNNCNIYAQLLSSSRGFEAGHLESEEPYRGDGLANCVTDLFAEADISQKIAHIYSSMNGEHYWTKELGTTYIRNKEKIAENFNIEHPVDCFGDTGAASGLILAGLAAFALFKGDIDTEALVYASSDHGERCAVLVG